MLIVLVLCAPGRGSAQTETDVLPIIPFLEGTDVFWTVQSGEGLESVFPNKLEANIFPHLVVRTTFANLINISDQESRGIGDVREFAYAFSGTPAVRIRMLRETSAPVRTPSYMPRGNIQFIWARGLKANLQRSARDAGAASIFDALRALPQVSLWEAHLIVGHHSNGQDGCLSTEQQRVPPDTGDCLPADTVPTASTINRIDGTFSTNYFRAGLNYSRNWMTAVPTGAGDVQAVREARAKVELEYHPRPLVDEDIVDLYGRARLNLEGAYAARDIGFCEKRLEGSVGVVWNPGVVDTVSELSSAVQVSCFPTNVGGWGIFVRFYNGQDYYNVGFLDNIRRLHIGATFSQSGFFRFRRSTN